MPKAIAEVKNELIRASAGSGKTYRLTNRFIRIMALGSDPERLIALTFTRKAAGEFFDEILKKLAVAAEDPEAARRLAGKSELDFPGFDEGTAQRLLRQLVNRMHLLTLGTLDSFFNRILRSFPAEFGLSRDFEILEAHEKAAARRQVFARLFRDGGSFAGFLEEFRLATFGTEEKSLVSSLDQFVEDFHGLYLAAPEEERWAAETAIWSEGFPYGRGLGVDVAKECEALRPLLEYSASLHKSAPASWEKFFSLVRDYYPGYVRESQGGALLPRLLAAYPEMRAGRKVTIRNQKDHEIPPEWGEHLARLLDRLIYCDLFPHLKRTTGIFRVMRRFEERYDALIRREGRLGFDDVQQILSGEAQARVLSQVLSPDDERKLRIDYRLDGRFDHWLLDEFQDTSPQQWKVIENLVDEVVQDPSGQRTFFCVGDEKQAIFAWRGGDSRLFERLRTRYGERGLRFDKMEESWRSGPVILEAVNRVFGNEAALRELFPDHPAFLDRWKDAFKEHRAHHRDRVGFVQLIQALKQDGEPVTMNESRYEIARAILEELRPDRRGLTCAVLVRRNDRGAEFTDYLREKSEIPAVFNSDAEIGCDHPLGTSFLALLKFAAHPRDTLAWKHLCMTPAFAAADAPELADIRGRLAMETLRTVFDHGFAFVLEAWVERFSSAGVHLDSYGRERLKSMMRAAREFDFTGNRCIEEFIAYFRTVTSREAPAEGVVQVMTIHKAKGLTFDAVLVVDVEGDQISSANALGVRAFPGDDREAEWVLSFPRKDICEADAVLREALRRIENERAFDELCTLYVALTRAKFANYIITSESKAAANGDDRGNLRTILAKTLCDGAPVTHNFGDQAAIIVHSSGVERWFEDREVTEAAARARQRKGEESEVSKRSASRLSMQRRFAPLRRRFPSAVTRQSERRAGARWFSSSGMRAGAFGTLVHALFEQIEWMESLLAANLEKICRDAVDLSIEDVDKARAEVHAALDEPAICAFFERPGTGVVEVWREKRFEMVHESEWVSGTFDRVLVSFSDEGQPVSATIIDFKTNRVTTPEEIAAAREHYAGQMKLYRQALSALTGLECNAIGCRLVFTYPRTVVDL